ncbi:MAG: hypothetical protein H8E73_04550 [Planctomycetes bacterium]|nr:hypothetical protein [Planctomycetota bacterium]
MYPGDRFLTSPSAPEGFIEEFLSFNIILLLRTLYQEWLKVAPDFFGDYYPLSAHNLDKTALQAMSLSLRSPNAPSGTA